MIQIKFRKTMFWAWQVTLSNFQSSAFEAVYQYRSGDVSRTFAIFQRYPDGQIPGFFKQQIHAQANPPVNGYQSKYDIGEGVTYI